MKRSIAKRKTDWRRPGARGIGGNQRRTRSRGREMGWHVSLPYYAFRWSRDALRPQLGHQSHFSLQIGLSNIAGFCSIFDLLHCRREWLLEVCVNASIQYSALSHLNDIALSAKCPLHNFPRKPAHPTLRRTICNIKYPKSRHSFNLTA